MAWVDTVQKIDSSDSDLNFGMVALAGEDTLFDNVQIGRDTDSDGVIDDLERFRLTRSVRSWRQP